ncbi:MAG: GntR family transcriptional regulator [Acidobacteriota bacterium]|nr:GntR family transcriptional regulator [Acidobacteriota bacterium]
MNEVTANEQLDEPLQLERVYQEIKWRIVHARYAPGFVLSEGMLARVHKASRTPVRDALARLQEEGYVEREPRRGFRVSPITVATLQQTYEVRRLLEGDAAELAAARADEKAIAHMRALANYPLLDKTPESYGLRLKTNDDFHLAVAGATQNGFLLDLVRRCLTQHNRVLLLSTGVNYPTLPGSVPQHHEIVDAIEARDAAAARRMMLAHLEDAYALVMRLVESGAVRGVSA